MKSEIHSLILDRNPEAILFDGLDECMIGMDSSNRIVYCYDKIVKHFINSGMNEDDAVEWVDFNILNLHLGEYTPIIVFPF